MLIPIEVVAAYMAQEGRLPVNMVFLFEGEEEVGSAHLEPFVAANTELLESRFRAVGGRRAVAGGPAERHRRQPRHLRAGSHA